MPVLIPIIVTGLEALGASAIVATIGAYAIATLATVAALYGAQKLLAPKPKDSLTANNQLIRNAIANRQIAYGKTSVGGNVVYIQQSGPNNEYLDLVFVMTTHEINSVQGMVLDNWLLAFDGTGLNGGGVCTGESDVRTGAYSTRFSGLISAQFHLGVPGEGADTILMSNSGGAWPSTATLSGCSYVYVRMTWNQNAFSAGVPNIYCIIEGKKVLDPRTGITAYSNNSALCALDYMMDPTYGFRAQITDFDPSYLTQAANDCDDAIPLNPEGTEPRYTTNGCIDTGDTPGSILDDLLGAMQGQVVRAGGKWYMRAGTYQTPAGTALTDSDLRSPISFSTKLSRRDSINGCKGTYIEPAAQWEATDYSPYQNATYVADDGGVVLWQDASLAFTTSNATAQRLAKIMTERSRAGQVVLNVQCKLTALRFLGGDNILVTLSRPGYDSQVFEVMSWKFAHYTDSNKKPALGIDMQLRGTAEEAFDWDSGDENPYEPTPLSNLPNPFIVQNPTGLSLSSTVVVQQDGSVISSLVLTWTAPGDGYVTSGGTISIEYRVHGTSNWLPWPSVAGDATTAVITNVNGAVAYDVRIQSVNSINVPAASWVEVDDYTVGGQTSAPSLPTGFTATGLPEEILLAWTKPSNSDLAGFDIYELGSSTPAPTSTTTPTFSLGPQTQFTVTNLTAGSTIYFWIRSRNTSNVACAWVGPVSAVVGNGTAYVLTELNGKNHVFYQGTAPSSGMIEGDLWFDTADMDKVYRYTSGAWVAVQDGNIPNLLTDMAAVAGSYVVTVTGPGGYITGFELNPAGGGGGGGAFNVVAAQFGIYNNVTNGVANPFLVDSLGTYIDHAIIREVDAGAILSGTISAAISIASGGSLTAGSGANQFYTDGSGITLGYFSVHDDGLGRSVLDLGSGSEMREDYGIMLQPPADGYHNAQIIGGSLLVGIAGAGNYFDQNAVWMASRSGYFLGQYGFYLDDSGYLHKVDTRGDNLA